MSLLTAQDASPSFGGDPELSVIKDLQTAMAIAEVSLPKGFTERVVSLAPEPRERVSRAVQQWTELHRWLNVCSNIAKERLQDSES